MGEPSGEGERDGNEVRLLSEGGGAFRCNEAVEGDLRGLERLEADFLLPEEAEWVEEVRRRAASLLGLSMATRNQHACVKAGGVLGDRVGEFIREVGGGACAMMDDLPSASSGPGCLDGAQRRRILLSWHSTDA